MPGGTKITIESISVSAGSARLEAGGLEKMEGAHSAAFEIWIRRDGTPEMIPYTDGTCREFVKDAIDEILNNTPY